MLQQYVCAVLSVLTQLKYSVVILASYSTNQPASNLMQTNILVDVQWKKSMKVSLSMIQQSILLRAFRNPQTSDYLELLQDINKGNIPYALTLMPVQSPSSKKLTPNPPTPNPPTPNPPTPKTDDSGGGMGILFIVLLLLAAAVTFSKK